jgi:hypothetical protein
MKKARIYTTWIVLLLCGLSMVPSVPAESVSSLNVPYYSQNVDAWSTEHLGSNPFFIRDAGCALTSMAMVFAFYGLAVDPSILNTWLTVHNGYDEQGNIRWKTAAEISTNGIIQTVTLDEANDVKIWASTRDSPVLADLNVINSYLRSGHPVLAQVWYTDFNYEGGWHWVVLTGYSTLGNTVTYTIHDPYIDSSNINGLNATTIPDPRFYERQTGGAAGTIYGIVVFRGLPRQTGLIAGNDRPPWKTDDVSIIDGIAVPSISPPTAAEGTITTPLSYEMIPYYTGLIEPGTEEDVSLAVRPTPTPEAETGNKASGGDPVGEYNPMPDRIPYTSPNPQEYPVIVLPDLPGSAQWGDTGSGPVISLPTVPAMTPLY